MSNIENIIEDTIIYLLTPTDGAGVYVGSLTELKDAKPLLKPHTEMSEYPLEWLTLDEIRTQIREVYGSDLIYVFQNSPLHGDIYCFGNHGDHWELVGSTVGYA